MKSLVLAVMLSWSALLYAADPSRPHILVAKPELRDLLFGSSVLVVKPVGGDQHVGFIVNRPTGIALGNVFPEHGPSQKIVDPVYLGNSLEVLPGLYAAFEAPVVDQIIESEADHARFLAGLVVWRAGEGRAGAPLRREKERHMSKPRSILDRSFHYEPSISTDIRKTFERIRREQQQAREKVLPLHPVKKAAQNA